MVVVRRPDRKGLLVGVGRRKKEREGKEREGKRGTEKKRKRKKKGEGK